MGDFAYLDTASILQDCRLRTGDRASILLDDRASLNSALGGFLVKIGDNVTNWGLGEAPNFEKFIRNYWMRENGVEDCASAIEGKVITTRDGKNRYYCFANSWNSASIWSWDYPKEIYYNINVKINLG